MLINILGKDYRVWDKFACIEFVAPGRGTVTAEFTLDDDRIEMIRRETAACEKYIAELPVDITSADGEIVAKATKHLYVRLKNVCAKGGLLPDDPGFFLVTGPNHDASGASARKERKKVK